AFAAFSLCASAGYVVNDIIDRPQDRLHPRRRRRPIASGEAPLGVVMCAPN
ncbi:MAG: UbiA family prenyltransferase, partial [Burkholderiales bacterium]